MIPLLGVALVMAGCSGLNRQDASEWADLSNEPGTLSVMSFNVLVGGRPADVVLDAIADASPDLVCLQEITSEFAGNFERRFAAAYPHRFFVPGPTIQGIGIASRFPMTDARLLELDLPHQPALAATMRPDTRPVHVACVHFVTPFARYGPQAGLADRYYRHKTMRMGQARALLQHIDSVDMPAIVLGDMNEWEGQAALTILAEAGFRNACRARDSRCGATWPGRAVFAPAVIRIDHILGRGVEFRQAMVLNSGGSDHYPVAARFAVAGDAR
jgi:endonuclease/exonuclease/phosphatase (EEP) superfamily protein YafD